MPLLLAAAAGGVGGFIIANKTTELARLLVIGGIVFYLVKRSN